MKKGWISSTRSCEKPAGSRSMHQPCLVFGHEVPPGELCWSAAKRGCCLPALPFQIEHKMSFAFREGQRAKQDNSCSSATGDKMNTKPGEDEEKEQDIMIGVAQHLRWERHRISTGRVGVAQLTGSTEFLTQLTSWAALCAVTPPAPVPGPPPAPGWPGAWDIQGRGGGSNRPGAREPWGGEEEICLVYLLGARDLRGLITRGRERIRDPLGHREGLLAS
ncbi:uncharacterized protein LOC129199832 [Grus americana]|uniref:uncharacterized protein LOC129199832 n=1 Tax=Grus americana TaxID=9117 RepID=UPI002407D25E|nr:uncharacterized protein LOC129199832 [Grus americana]